MTRDHEPPSDWFRNWFGETYLALYPHRDEAEAADGVRLFRREVDPGPGASVLDLACGAGRHLPHLRRAGYRAVGLDLSAALLREARGRGESRLVRGDMRRLPFADDAFDATVNFFTSFGYFDDEAEDRRTVAEVERVLCPGGAFLVDYLNAPMVREGLVPEDERLVGGRRVRQRRWLEGGAVVKRIEIASEGDSAAADSRDTGARGTESRDEGAEVHYERVRLYEPGELESILESEGLAVEARFGSYEGGAYGSESPRLILVGRRA